jgi:Flp pilus assembly protein TadG
MMLQRIMRFVRLLAKGEKGASLVIVAIFMVILLGMVGLVIDGGRLYMERAVLQDAVDAAALAGAPELPISPNAVSEAENAASRNGVSTTDVDVVVTISNPDTTIRVEATRNVSFTFARLLGFTDSDVSAHAIVKGAGSITAARGVSPLALSQGDYKFGQKIDIIVDQWQDHMTMLCSGCFGPLQIDKPGANEYVDALTSGSTKTVSVGQILNFQTGNMIPQTNGVLADRVDDCPGATIDNYPSGCRRIILVPIIKILPSKEAQVVGFASMFILGKVGGNWIGQFIEKYMSGPSDPSVPGFHVSGYRLVE